MIKSKFSISTWPIAIVLILLPLQLFYAIYIIVVSNISNLTNLMVVVQIVVLILSILFILIMLERNTRIYLIQEDILEIKHILGLYTKTYDFKNLKFSFYSWTTKLVLIELPNGRQLTLGKNQYMNFDEIVEILKARIPNENLKFKFVNRLTVFIAVATVLLFLMVFQLGKG